MRGVDPAVIRAMRTRVKGRPALIRRLHGLRLAVSRYGRLRAETDADRRWAACLADALDAAAAVADPRSVSSRWRDRGQVGDSAATVGLGRQVGARYAVSGQVEREPERLTITAAVYDTETGAVLGTPSVSGRPEALSELLDQVARELIFLIGFHFPVAVDAGVRKGFLDGRFDLVGVFKPCKAYIDPVAHVLAVLAMR